MKKDKGDLGKFLEFKFISWQQQLGRRATLSEFADYLDLDRTQLSQYMNGHILPKKEIVDRIAKKVGYEIYDLLNLERPDPLLVQLTEAVSDPTEREFLIEVMESRSDPSDRDLLQKVMESIGDPTDRQLLQKVMESSRDPIDRQLLLRFLGYIRGLDDDGREEIYRRLQSENKTGIGSFVKTKPSPKAE